MQVADTLEQLGVAKLLFKAITFHMQLSGLESHWSQWYSSN